MALSFLFPKQPLQSPNVTDDGAWVFFGGAFRTWAISNNDDGSFTSRQIFAHSNPHTGHVPLLTLLSRLSLIEVSSAGRGSTATPPYHWHLYQTETFDVNSGILCYLLDGKEGKLRAGESVTIVPGRWHTFWSDPDSGVDLDVNITVRGGPNPGFDEKFVRNFYGYLSSCTMQSLAPNPIQMLTFMYSADVVLDMPLGLGRPANYVLGNWLGWLGGFKTEYTAFSEEKAK
ncbi:RNA-binding protein [Mycena indigotica]|uniref:RNA-binding protein n=1 Tax=Mycena indigotica TaxID=2126181 RepID=A0A8H6RZX9_9AGAR|nr:RNA-binding protein [Mycena indigotica]KAF7289347.1 RNA-binding protein [Mycena indigotica]